MGKVQAVFGNGSPGAITRSVDDIVISVKNAYSGEIAFGTPVFLDSDGALTAVSGQEGTTVLLENVRIRRPAGAGGRSTEVTVNRRNLI